MWVVFVFEKHWQSMFMCDTNLYLALMSSHITFHCYNSFPFVVISTLLYIIGGGVVDFRRAARRCSVMKCGCL